MKTILAKCVLLAIVLAGFFCTGDLPRLVTRARRALPNGERDSDTSRNHGHALPTAPQPPPNDSVATKRPTPDPAASPAPLPVVPKTASETPPPSTVAPAAGSTVPLPPLRRGPIRIGSLQPGDRVLVRLDEELVAFDLIDVTSGEAIEHRHVIRGGDTVQVSARESPRRVRISGVDGPIAAGGRMLVESSIRDDGASRTKNGPDGARTIGPILAVGLETGG